jgi:hypothetical protein
MSIEQKIAQLMEEAKKLEASEEVKSLTEEDLDLMSEEQLDELVENFEELDELSKATLGSYVKKSASNIDAQAGKREVAKDMADRLRQKLSRKQNSVGIGDLVAGVEKSDAAAAKADNSMNKRKAGIGKAVSRLTKEEVEVTEMIDLGNLFEGEEFSEEFKSKAAELFEAAVEARIKQEIAQIEEEVSQRLVNESAELKEGLVDKVDGYLDYVVEQWMQKNELALDRGIKVEIFESFVSGMKDLFETHYIEVPEEKFDLMESVDAKAKTLEEQVDFLTAQNVELQQKFKLVAKERQIEEAANELTDLEAERFKQLAEELAYDDEESFGKKLELVKENYISKSKQVKTVVESVVTDSPVELNEEKQVDASMARYMNAFKAR